MSPEEETLDNQNTSNEMGKLNLLYRRATVLLRCKTVFPFDIFPNTLIIDYNKVDVIYRSFFKTSEIMSIPIARINHVTVDSVAFLSTLQIDVKGFEHKPPPLRFLRTSDAHLAQSLLFGLISAHADKIDLSKFSTIEIMDKLVGIGSSRR